MLDAGNLMLEACSVRIAGSAQRRQEMLAFVEMTRSKTTKLAVHRVANFNDSVLPNALIGHLFGLSL